MKFKRQKFIDEVTALMYTNKSTEKGMSLPVWAKIADNVGHPAWHDFIVARPIWLEMHRLFPANLFY